MMKGKDQNPPLYFRYKFAFHDGQEKKFELTLNAETLELISLQQSNPPEWTKLNYYNCDDCPLIGKVDYCPVAVNFSAIVDSFRDTLSYANAFITVETEERIYSKDTAVQKGLSSIIGICMTTSNCPILDELRPMTRFHLPFATTHETLYRAVSYYLTRQFFVAQDGKQPDWGLNHLIEIYTKISMVNKGIAKRVLHASEKDANVNAVVILHSYGDLISFFIENNLAEIKYLFQKFI